MTEMAKWIATVTLAANAFLLDDGRVIRDSQAQRTTRKSTITKKRAAPEAAIETAFERLLKYPRIAALRERIRAKEAAAAAGQGRVPR